MPPAIGTHHTAGAAEGCNGGGGRAAVSSSSFDLASPLQLSVTERVATRDGEKGDRDDDGARDCGGENRPRPARPSRRGTPDIAHRCYRS